MLLVYDAAYNTLIVHGHVAQAMLLDSLFGTERGLQASSELRGEINELITRLEAGSPNTAPNEARPLAKNKALRQRRLSMS